MPAKPRHKRGKLSSQARRRPEVRAPAAAAQPGNAAAPSGVQPASAQAPAVQSQANRPAARPAKGAMAPPSQSQVLAHLQVGTELRTIGIITGVLVVILVVLSFVIH